jgi:ligand-binding sensor domain-containing protein
MPSIAEQPQPWQVAAVIKLVGSGVVLTALVLGFLGCRAASPGTTDQDGAAQDPSASAPKSVNGDVATKGDGTVTASADTGDASGPAVVEGSVYLAVEGKGIVRLDHSGAERLAVQPNGEITDLFVGPNDGVYALADHSLYEIEGETVVTLADLSAAELAPVRSAVRTSAGEIWIASERGVGVRVGETWQLTSLTELGLESAELTVALDHEGTIWVVADQRALYREQDRWQPVEFSLLAEGAMLLNPQSSRVGRVHVNNGHRLTRLGKQDFDSVIVDPKAQLRYDADLDLNAEGHAVVATASCDLGRVSARPPTQIWRFAGKDYQCQKLEAVALDSRLRVWVAAREGLSVIEQDRTLHEYPAGSFAALDGRVRDMVVVAGGPKLPPTP